MADFEGSFSGSFTGSYDILTHNDQYTGATYGYVLHQRTGIGKAENILLSDFFRNWLGSESGSAGIQDYAAGGYINDQDRILIRSGSFDGSTYTPIIKTATIGNLFGGYNASANLRNTFIYARGVGRNTNSPSVSSSVVLTVGGQVLIDKDTNGGDQAGLHLTILNANDFSKVSTTRYDTTTSAAASTNLATAIDQLTTSQIAVLTSLGYWEENLNDNLRVAAKKVGLTKLGGYVSTSSGSAYSAVFYGTSGSAGVGDSLERLVSYRFTTATELDIPTAVINTRVQSNVQNDYPFVNIAGANSTNALYAYNADTSSVLTPALFVDSEGNVTASGNMVISGSLVGGASGNAGATGSIGNIAFFTGSKDISGSNALYWDEGNGRMGIGTTSPESTLNVLGDIQFGDGTTRNKHIIQPAGFHEGTILSNNIHYDGSSDPNTAANNSYIDASGSNNSAGIRVFMKGNGAEAGTYFRIQTAPTSVGAGSTLTSLNTRFHVGGDGNVGIGTTSPNSALDVVGTISGSSTVYLPSIGTGEDDSVVILDSDGTLRTDEIDSRVWGTTLVDTDGTGTNNELATWSDSNTIIGEPNLTFDGSTLNVTGNVGIGTTDPQSKLHVQGTISASGNLNVEGNNIGLAGQWQNNSGTSLDTVQIGDYSSTARGIIFATDGTAPAAIAFAESVSSLSSRIVFQNEDNSIDFQTNDGSLTTKMTISGSGNVGIGTTSPSDKLDVRGSAVFSSSAFVGVTIDQSDSGKTSFGVTSGTAESFINSIGNAGFAGAGELKFLIESSEKVRIDNAGNVGIGTTSPTALLDVASPTQATGAVMRLSNTAASSTWGTGDTIGTIAFYSSDASAAGEKALIEAVQESGTGLTYPNNVALDFKTSTNNALSTAMRIDASGNVGIGTTTPIENLHIGGNREILFDSNVGDIIISGSTGGWATALRWYGSAGTNHGGFGALGSADTLTYYWIGPEYSNPKMVILDSGEVGIGTTSPGELLHLSASGDANIRLENSGNGNTSAIEFVRQRSSGTGALGGAIWIESDTSTNSARMYFDANTIANTPGDTTLNTNSARMVLRGGTPALSLYAGTAGPEVRLTTTGLGIGTTSPNSALDVVGTISGSSTVYLPSIGTGEDDSVVILDSDGTLRTDEIDSRVWGTTLVDTNGTGTNNELATWSDSNTIIGESNLTFDGSTLNVTGTVTATVDVTVTSDIRSKNELPDTVQGLEAVDKLRPIKYTLKDDEDENPKTHLGFSAQELLDIVPEVVNTDDEGYHSVSYQKLVPVLVKAIQELTEEVRELKKKVEE